MCEEAHLWDLDGSCLGVTQTIGSLGISVESEGPVFPKGENNTMQERGPVSPELHTWWGEAQHQYSPIKSPYPYM